MVNNTLEVNNIYHGDCLELMQYIPDKSIDMLLTDIPYDELHKNKGGTLREIRKGLADVATFKLHEYLETVYPKVRGSFYIFCGQEQVSDIRRFFREKGLTTRIIIYEKTNPSPLGGKFVWLSGIEMCVFARKPNSTFNGHCRNTVLRYPSGRSKQHPTEKPLKLFEELILVSSNEGDVILDTCLGSGTTAIAAINTGRNYIGIEKEEEYYLKSLERIDNALKTFNLP